jgi:DNA repair exonuclease SbcCD ATPase subunit
MDVSKISLKNFTSYREQVIEFPAAGIVAVTGENGAGKSTLFEAVSFVLWGKTLRDYSPWSEKQGYAHVEFADGLRVIRQYNNGRTTLAWGYEGKEEVEYETTTKAQEALERVVGPWEVWQRSSVFSSADPSPFTTATDGERKRLLESVLGIDRFDLALSQCRLDIRKLENTKAALVSEAASAQKTLDALAAQLIQVSSAVPPKDAKGSSERIGPVQVQIAELGKALKKARAKQYEQQSALATAKAHQAASERRRKLLSGEQCPTCEQPIPKKLRDDLNADVIVGCSQALVTAGDAEATLDTIADIEDELGALQQDERGLLADIARSKVVLPQVASLQAAMDAAEEERENKLHEAKLLDKELATLLMVEKVLGLRGVRAHILGSALSSIEEVANSYLAAMGRVRVSLSQYTEKKTGGLSESLAVKLRGERMADSYKGASGGERRRVDVALLLALGAFSAASSGRAQGTLFVDEVFDSLDKKGAAAVAALVKQLSADRCVVVISHNEDVIASLDADRNLIVRDGCIE